MFFSKTNNAASYVGCLCIYAVAVLRLYILFSFNEVLGKVLTCNVNVYYFFSHDSVTIYLDQNINKQAFFIIMWFFCFYPIVEP